MDSNLEKVTVCTLNMPKESKYSIKNHREYPQLVANMIPKSQCAVSKKKFGRYILRSDCKIPDISKHPEYQNLLAKYKKLLAKPPRPNVDLHRYILKTQIPPCPNSSSADHDCSKHFIRK